ncbi:NAD(P)/FAD-dependent oxidoreductase [Cellulomonas pakistanensis]|uniref:FAD-dependent oxidoreductase n=1 Tax=Cellulomonas pakistanensis TaxID=992287 RepID=A0A919PGQ2_9CELL|nr:FAD-dependent oxidoreductase [Cellulomonas pakistanensis]GIG37847.1 FAD-dependent oxidoreductase [Cellulomonas pakistanensis]
MDGAREAGPADGGTTHDGWATTLRWSTGGDLASTSLWFDQAEADDHRPARDPLDGDTTADVVVVGAGLTGLWTAYYLLEADPALDVLVLDQGVAGQGASGRTGGWYGAGSPAAAGRIAAAHGAQAARSARAALRDAVVEVGGVAAAELVDADVAVGGLLTVARTPAQLTRLTADAAAAESFGDEVEVLSAEQVAEHAAVAGALGGTLDPDAGRLQPVRLVRGLVDVLTAHGARVVEGTRALRLSPGAVVTDQGTVRAPGVARTTGGGPAAGARHAIATEPLAPDVWAALGLRRGTVLADGGHRPVRALRTADDRLVLSLRTGRAPAAPSGRDLGAVFRLHAALVGLLPAGAHLAVTHAWSTAVAGAPDGVPALGLDADAGLAWADGAGDDGIAAGNLAGRTLADLLTGSDTALTRLPWVTRGAAPGGAAPLAPGATGGRLGGRLAAAAREAAVALADREERLTGRPSRLARAAAGR